jgi:hypothetical protein
LVSATGIRSTTDSILLPVCSCAAARRSLKRPRKASKTANKQRSRHTQQKRQRISDPSQLCITVSRHWRCDCCWHGAEGDAGHSVDRTVWTTRHHPHQHRFHWEVEYRGACKPAFLTYVLLQPEDRYRRTLAVEVRQSDFVQDWLKGSALETVRELEQLIRKKRSKGLRRTGAAKAVAIDIFKGNVSLPNVDIAVHKFGAVPVYVIPDSTSRVTIFDQDRDCRVGIFVSGSAPVADADRKLGPVNALELLRSLEIRPDLTFLRYLEDVGEYAADLQSSGNWASLFRLGRKIEEVLGASVASKIDNAVLLYAHSLPTDGEDSAVRNAARVEASAVLARDREMLWKFSSARILYLLVLNQLYRSIGMLDECDRFSQEYEDNWKNYFDSIEQRELARESDGALADLHLVWTALNAADAVEQLSQLQREPQDRRRWLNRLIDFASFACRIARLQLDAASTKVFLASRHTDKMRGIRRDASSVLDEHFQEQAQILFVESNQAGFPFADELEPKIWLSDALLACYSSRRTQTSELFPDRDWVSYEVDRARRYGLPIAMFKDNSISLAEIQQALEQESPQSAVLAQKNVVLNLPESTPDRRRLLEQHLVTTVEKAAARKCNVLLTGFLKNFFSPPHQWLIAKIHLLQIEPQIDLNWHGVTQDGWKSVARLAAALEVGERYLALQLKKIRANRRGLFNPTSGVEVPVLLIDRHATQCQGNLLSAIEILRPDLDQQHLKASLAAIMRAFLP